MTSIIQTLMMLQVPYHKQATSFTCGPSALKMVLSYQGKTLSERYIAKLEKAMPKEGTSHIHMIKTASKLGFYSFIHDQSTVHSLKHFIKEKLPVIVNYCTLQRNTGHYAVVIGFDDKDLILNDPHYGKGYRIPIGKFEKHWLSGDHIYKKWIMVINNIKFNLGRQYSPK